MSLSKAPSDGAAMMAVFLNSLTKDQFRDALDYIVAKLKEVDS